ncbi:MAG: hypothetical protein ABUL71_03070 [Gemmatimonadota bacterium]
MRNALPYLLAYLLLPSTPPVLPPPPPAFPWQRVGLDRAQLADLERGVAVLKVLDTKNKRDVAVFGVIRTEAPRAGYEHWLTDFPRSLQGPTRLRFGIFHDPATAADVEAVTLDRNDLADARNCRPGNCGLKIPATEMQKIQARIDWTPAADPAGQINRYLRLRLVEYATDYRTRGDSAMVVYDDVGHVHASDAFAALLDQVHDVYGEIPSLRSYFGNYPHAVHDSAHAVLYWAQDSVPGLKSILSVTHQVVYQPPEYSGVTFVASKEIYAGHFFEGALDLTAVVDRPAAAGSYLVVLRLARFDDLPSGPIISVRNKVTAKLRDQLRADLERMKGTAERVARP